MTDTTEDLDAQDIAATELAQAMVPAPDDLLSDVGPLAQLWFLNQCTAHVLTGWAGMLSGTEAKDVEDDTGPVRALAAISMALGELNAACVAVSIFPPDAMPDDA